MAMEEMVCLSEKKKRAEINKIQRNQYFLQKVYKGGIFF